MEQRSEPRIAVEAEVTVEVLGAQKRQFQAELLNLSSRGMLLVTPCSLELDAALVIHLEKDLYLGEVIHCATDRGRFRIGVALFNVMRNAAAVSERLNRILQPR